MNELQIQVDRILDRLWERRTELQGELNLVTHQIETLNEALGIIEELQEAKTPEAEGEGATATVETDAGTSDQPPAVAQGQMEQVEDLPSAPDAPASDSLPPAEEPVAEDGAPAGEALPAAETAADAEPVLAADSSSATDSGSDGTGEPAPPAEEEPRS